MFNLFKKKDTKPDFPELYLNFVNFNSRDELGNFFMSYEKYVDKSEGKSMHEEDLETIAQWKKDNPDWMIDVETGKIWKLLK